MSISVSLPELNRWMLRIGADPKLAEDLLRDPLLFYAFYAAAGQGVMWPQELQAELDKHEDEGDTEDMLGLMSALKVKASTQVSSEYVSDFQKGSVVLRHYRGKANELAEIIDRTLQVYDGLVETQNLKSSAHDTLEEIGDLGDFSQLERQLLLVSFALRASTPFMVFMELACENKQRARIVLPIMLQCEESELQTALNDEGALAKSGVVSAGIRGRKLQPLSEFWTDFLAGDGRHTTVFSRLLKPFEIKGSTGAVGRLQAEDADVVKSLMQAEGNDETAVNVLLYGAGSVNKKAVVKKVLDEAGLSAWTLNTTDAADSDLGSLCFLAQRALAQTGRDRDILVVDKASNVLSGRKMTQFLFFSFASDDEEELKSADEILLLENPVRAIWLATASTRLSEESLGCFLYHSEIKRGSRAERRQKVEEIIRSQGFSEKLEQELALQAGLSEQQLRSALLVARITSKGNSAKAEAHIMQAVTRSQLALDRREKDDLRIPVTHYSLKYLNTSGKFGAEQIITALKRRPSGTLCFYGIPGTGKSQLAEFIAGELDRPLLMRRASELLDKYLGESEKRIAEMFAEAEAEEAILLLDEADTFLRDRTQANHSWEVSQVNELLQRMERFPGIFICATNLFKQLDSAALRRFTFKLEFKALTPDQRWEMFLNESGLNNKQAEMGEAVEDIREGLNQIEFLTPGDFATVKRQCILLGEDLSFDEWLEQLRIEASMKQKATEERKMGFTA